MITRPLDLAARLRPEPRNADWLFYVNAGLLVFLFVLFGSRFVVSPGLAVDFKLPAAAGARADARPTTHMIKVVNAGQIFVADGVRRIDQLPSWLEAQANTAPHPVLLVQASEGVPTAMLMRILGMAHTAGFSVMLAAAESGTAGENGR